MTGSRKLSAILVFLVSIILPQDSLKSRNGLVAIIIDRVLCT